MEERARKIDEDKELQQAKQRELKEHQERFMQQVKRRMAEKWESIERIVNEGETQKKQIESAKIKDLERKLEQELDRMIELNDRREEKNKEWIQELKRVEGRGY
jgi:hypothetical protein